MTAENPKGRHLDPENIARMSIPDMHLACKEHSGPIDQLMAMGDWGRFRANRAQDRMRSLKTVWEEAPWGRDKKDKPYIGEAIFLTWFALHDQSVQVRRFCAGLITKHTGTKVSPRFRVNFSPEGSMVHKHFEAVRQLQGLKRASRRP